MKQNKLAKLIKKPRLRGSARKAPVEARPVAPPRITSETITEHREEVLSSARKYVLPGGHTKHQIVKVSIGLAVMAIVAFFAYCGLALYKFQTTSGFMYGVSRVVPFPVAKAGSDYISYESYLFELRHFTHYYSTQQQIDFSTESGKQQLANFKRKSLDQVIDDTLVRRLAKQHNVSVSRQEVDDEVELVRSQNRLGSNDQVFRDVLQNFWGWSVNDFRRELKQQLLEQKVVAKLDSGTHERAEQAIAQLNKGVKFEKLAAKVSDDKPTKSRGGEYGGWIGKTNRDVAPKVTDALFKLKPGQYSDIIDTGYSLEIIKVLERNGDKVRAAHISFNLKGINTYLEPLKAHEDIHRYIKV